MKIILIVLCSVAMLLQGGTAGTNYYVDATGGNDSGDGKSVKTAWKTLSKVNAGSFAEGDMVFLKSGETFDGELNITSSGITVSSYGKGGKPRIVSSEDALWGVQIYNAQNITVENLDISNCSAKDLKRRAGVRVELKNYGIAKNITLRNLDIHDIRGSLFKNEGGGAGIFIFNGGNDKPSYYDGLTIENCTIKRTHRNGIIFEGYANRQNWHPSLNVLVRGNLIEECPGDGIVPWGCHGAIVEYNVMRNCPATLPEDQAAAGIWPWSCDNTIIRFNEVSDHKAPWDAQGFDSDYNCNNTLIEYNYSHENEGGFVLICNSGKSVMPDMVGNNNTIVRYNISVNDAMRQRTTRSGIFSPSIHIAGPTANTLFESNIIYSKVKPAEKIDRTLISSTSWDGFSNNTRFNNNIFCTEEPSRISLEKSTENSFSGNIFIGKITGDGEFRDKGELSKEELSKNIEGLLAKNPKIKDSKIVNPEAAKKFFENISK